MYPESTATEEAPPPEALAEEEITSPAEEEYIPDKPFAYRFTVKQQEEIGEWLCRMIEDGRRAFFQGGRPANVQAWRDAYNSVAPGNRVLPFQDAPNYHTVLTQVMTDTVVARTFKVTTGIKPYCKAETQAARFQEPAERIEGFFQSVLTNQMDFVTWQRTSLLPTAIDGTYFAKTCWERNVRRWYEEVPLTMDVLAEMGYDTSEPIPDGAEFPLEDADGVERMVRMGETHRVEREEITYNAPRVHLFPLEDHVVYPATFKKLENAILVGQRTFKTVSDIWAGVDAGLYDRKAVLRMFAKKPRPYNRSENVDGWSDLDAGAEYDDLAPDVSTEPQTLADGAHLENYEVTVKFDPEWWRTYHRRKKAGATEEELLRIPRRDTWHVARVNRATKTLLAFLPFPYPYPDNQTWYDMYRLYEDPQSPYGKSIAQILAPIQKETNDRANIAMAMNMLGMSVRIIRDRNSQDSTQPFHPGVEEIRVEDVQNGYRIENITVNTMPIKDDRAYLDDQAERAIAASEATQGVNPATNRTASENQLVAAQGAVRLDVPLSVWQGVNTRIFNKCLLLFPDYMDDVAEYRLSGGNYDAAKPLFGFVTRDDFVSGVRIYAYGDTLNTNETLKAQAAEKMWMMYERAPWLQGDWVKGRDIMSEAYMVFGQGAPDALIGSRDEVEKKQQERDEAAKSAPPAIEPPKISLSDEAATALLVSAMPQHQQQAFLQAYQMIRQAGMTEEKEDPAMEQQRRDAETQAKLQTNAALADQKMTITQAEAEQKRQINIADAIQKGQIQQMLAKAREKQIAQNGAGNNGTANGS